MIAEEVEANFAAVDEDDDESSGVEEEDRLTPSNWAVTDDGKTPGDDYTMKNYEDEVM